MVMSVGGHMTQWSRGRLWGKTTCFHLRNTKKFLPQKRQKTQAHWFDTAISFQIVHHRLVQVLMSILIFISLPFNTDNVPKTSAWSSACRHRGNDGNLVRIGHRVSSFVIVRSTHTERLTLNSFCHVIKRQHCLNNVSTPQIWFCARSPVSVRFFYSLQIWKCPFKCQNQLLMYNFFNYIS